MMRHWPLSRASPVKLQLYVPPSTSPPRQQEYLFFLLARRAGVVVIVDFSEPVNCNSHVRNFLF